MTLTFAHMAFLLPAGAVDWRAVANALVGSAVAILGALYLIALFRRSRRSQVGQSITKSGIAFSLLTVGIAVVALHSKINFLVLLFGMMVSAFILSFVLSRVTMRGLDFARRLPSAVHAGEPFTVELRVANRKRRLASYGIVVRDELPDGLASERPGGLVIALAPREALDVPYTACASRRGVYALRSIAFSTRHPFGLFHQGRARALPGELVVYPRLGEVATGFLGRTRALALSQQRTHGALGEEEFRNLREYRPGDNPRRIHWKTSAKLGKPLVREFEAVVGQRLLILLDTRCPASGEPALEDAISFAASLARDMMARGFFVALAAYAPGLLATAPAKGQPALLSLYEALARLEPAAGRTLCELVAEPAVRAQGRVVTVLTLRCRDADSEAAIAALRQRQTPTLAVAASDPTFPEIFQFRHTPAPQPE